MTRDVPGKNSGRIKTRSLEGSSSDQGKQKTIPFNPFIVLLFITIAVVAIHSFNFSTFNFQATDSRGIMFVTVLGGGLLLATFYGLLGTAPKLIADAGNTTLAEWWAINWAKVTGTIGKLSTDHVQAQLLAARICRLNANFHKSIELCRMALESLGVREEHLRNMPALTPQQQTKYGNLLESMDLPFKCQTHEIELTMAWNYYDIGDYAMASSVCEEILPALEELRARESKRRTEKTNQPQKNILTRDLLTEGTERSNTVLLDEKLDLLSASVLELLGTIRASQNDQTAIKTFEDARSFRSRLRQPSLAVWETSYGFACMNLGRDNEAKEVLKEALSEYGDKCDKRILASLLSNLGETYRRLKETKKAKDSLERSLELKKKLYPAKHPEMAETHYYLGKLYADQGDRKLSREFFLKSADEVVACIGAKHPTIESRRNEMIKLGLAAICSLI